MAADPRALLQKADKAAQGATGGFSLFGGRTEKWENAADLYSQAANAFRVQKQCKHCPQKPTQDLTLTALTQHMKRDRLSKKPLPFNATSLTSQMTWQTP